MLNNIEKLKEQDNFGGGKYILYVDYKGIDVFPSVIDDNIVDDITLLAGYQWFRIDFPQQVLHYRGEPNEENGGRGNYNSISAFLPKDSLELQLITATMRTKRFVVLYFDSNGFQRVLGNKKKPAIFRRVSTDHKPDFAGRNEREILIEWPTREEPPFYQATPPEPVLVCTPVNELTCTELNEVPDGLTLEQRRKINMVPLTKTGQTASAFTGDDGDLEEGKGTAFGTLECNNPYNNSNRFTAPDGTQTYTANIVVDWQTGLMWYRTVQGPAVDWDTAMSDGNAISAGSFTDWHLPNIHQLQSIVNIGQNDTMNYAPFNIASASAANLWSSSSESGTSNAYRNNPVNGQVNPLSKGSGGVYFIVCRAFTLADVGL